MNADGPRRNPRGSIRKASMRRAFRYLQIGTGPSAFAVGIVSKYIYFQKKLGSDGFCTSYGKAVQFVERFINIQELEQRDSMCTATLVLYVDLLVSMRDNSKLPQEIRPITPLSGSGYLTTLTLLRTFDLKLHFISRTDQLAIQTLGLEQSLSNLESAGRAVQGAEADRLFLIVFQTVDDDSDPLAAGNPLAAHCARTDSGRCVGSALGALARCSVSVMCDRHPKTSDGKCMVYDIRKTQGIVAAT